MMIDFSVLIGGEAGFGIMTTGALLARIVTRLGFHIFDYVEYPSLIRGGHNAYFVHVSENRTRCLKETIDYLVCLNKDTFEKHKHQLTENSHIIYDNNEFQIKENYKLINIPFNEILLTLKGETIMKNTIALGALLALIDADIKIFNDLLEEQFGKKGQEVVQFNQQFAEKGYDYVKKNHSTEIKNILNKKSSGEKLVISGNEAFSLGASIADCRLYVAYPMTPSSSVLTVLAGWQEKTGMVVRHAEDEISVINTALGGSFAGVRSAVGTSGGGFALMVESISYAGIAEIPIVIFLAQRPGPATGMPTWTEQGDLLFAIHSGHGEFPKIVLVPGDVDEMIELTAKAFNLADQYQLPVIVMSDMLLSESHTSLDKSFVDNLIKSYKINRGKLISNIEYPTSSFGLRGTSPISNKYPRYQITEDGISPRLIPGTKGHYYQANSYEHFEDGHTTEDTAMRKKQVEKRERKWQTYFQNDFEGPKIIGDLEKAKTVLVTWGANKGALISAQDELKTQGMETAIMQFTHIYPLSKEKILPFFSNGKRFILVENNSQGQLGKLLQMEIGVTIKERILRYDGRPIMVKQIINYVTQNM